MRRVIGSFAALAIALSTIAIADPAAASKPPDGVCDNADPAKPVITQQPWAQQLFDLDRVWPYSTGAGVTVAVIDSGVDSDHPQLRKSGTVLRGQDFFLTGSLPATYDCVSHGTAVASIIAARPVSGVGFAGIAPGARILPVRVVDEAQSDTGNPTPIDPAVVGKGIRYAADQGAKVINLSLSGYRNFAPIRDAIRYAQAKDALIVTSVGNREQQAPASQSFPASYPGVIGVGGIDLSGARDDNSQVGPYVSVMAPGKSVVGASRIAGHDLWSGTSFAAPFVSGAAALVRAAWPRLKAQQVRQRLLATATTARGGVNSRAYGAGIVDPYRAVTEGLAGQPRALAPVTVKPPDPAVVRDRQLWSQASLGAKIATGIAIAAVVLVGISAWMLPTGRRRRWQPARTTPPAAKVRREEPPEQIFLFPVPAGTRPPSRSESRAGSGSGSRSESRPRSRSGRS